MIDLECGSTAAFPRIIPVDPPIVNINKNRSEKNTQKLIHKDLEDRKLHVK